MRYQNLTKIAPTAMANLRADINAMSKICDLKNARSEHAEVKSWTCQTCDTMVQRDGAHCDACRQYWTDVYNGVFDDDY